MNFRQFAAGMVMATAGMIKVQYDWNIFIGIAFFFVAWLIYVLILNWGKYE